MPEPIVYIDLPKSSKESSARTRRRSASWLNSEANVPRAISYGVYLDETGSKMTVVQIQPGLGCTGISH